MRGVIADAAVLDLTTVSDLSGITEIHDVAVVLVPESQMRSLMSIPMTDVAQVIPVPAGGRVNMRTGTVVMDGGGLADPAAENTVLVVTGALVLRSPVTKVTYDKIIVTGKVLAPHGSEPALEARLSSLATTGELTSKQVGEALDLPAGTVRYKLGQARKQLAAALELEE